jgi:DNA-binding PadR family transcriptional regulator
MSSDELTVFSYEVLGLVGSTGARPHDLRAMVRRGRMLDRAGESRYYVEPKRLARLGYLEARKEPGRTRERTVYTLTERASRRCATARARPCTSRPSAARPSSGC